MGESKDSDSELRINRPPSKKRSSREDGSITPPDSDLVDAHKNAQQQRRIEQLKRAIKQITALLANGEYEKAANVFARNKATFPQKKYDELVRHQKERDNRREMEQELVNEVNKLLSEGKFGKADDIFFTRRLISQTQYETIKASHIQKHLKTRLGFEIDTEKATALASCYRHVLISARAGSGKTTALACKAVMLMEMEGVKPDELMILAFNKKAANEIRERIHDKFGVDEFWNARTFHSLAYQVAQPKKNLLFDEDKEASTRKQAIFIKETLRGIWNPIFLLKMYSFFRKEMKEVVSAGEHLSEEDYLTYRRNLVQVSLRGERVKSTGEKFIADFLCEHGIHYQYERVQFWNKRNYRPDFIINPGKNEIVLEHWGIDESDPEKEIPKHWSKSWEEYRCEMHEKRSFWKERKTLLLETSICDMTEGREAFESVLRNKLQKAGVKFERLPESEIQNKIIETRISHIVDRFQEFILRAKKKGWEPEEAKKRIARYDPGDERETAFLDLASKVYEAYQLRLHKENYLDFDDLIESAAEKISSCDGDCSIEAHGKKATLKNLKWIMVDEYQDFSRLFDVLISSIREHNKDVRLICVGDDWQAINGFAGSDPTFFESFVSRLPKAGIASLLTNYRSPHSIVEYGNEVMINRGEPGRALPHNNGGEIFTQYVDDIWVDAQGGGETKSEDRKYLFFTMGEDGSKGKKIRDDGLLKAKYLKKCHQIIGQNLGKTIAIVSRTQKIGSTGLQDFKSKLKNCLSPDELREIGDFKNRIRIDTAHGFKGLEADVVIVIRACNGSFPIIHPDNCLFGLFGVTPQKVLDEERRLFYVAVTRAKEQLWLLTERERESDFLLTPTPQKGPPPSRSL